MVVALGGYKGIKVAEEPGTSLAYIAFNFEDPLLSKRDVRRALAYATDRESIIKYLLRGQARLASSLLPPNHWAYDGDVATYNYDSAKAESLLDSAGLPRGKDGVRFHLSLKTSTDEMCIRDREDRERKRTGIASLKIRFNQVFGYYIEISKTNMHLAPADYDLSLIHI